MKQLLFAAAMSLSVCSYAQSGSIHYTRTIKLGDITVDGLPPEMAAMIPKEHSDEKVLYFTPDATLYENNPVKKVASPDASSENGIQMNFGNSSGEEKIFTDLKNKKTVQQKELMGRLFLVSEDLSPLKWKMTGNQKKILDHPVMEATAIDDKDTITAWYTTDIAIPGGPETVSGLPGMVLEASVNRNMTIRATAVATDAAVSSRIKEPSKGKKVTAQEYAKIEKQKMAEMEKEMGGSSGGSVRTFIMKN